MLLNEAGCVQSLDGQFKGLVSILRVVGKDFPDGPVVKTLPFNARGVGSIPGGRTKIPHAIGCGQKLIKKKRTTFIKSQKKTSIGKDVKKKKKPCTSLAGV